MRTCSKCGKEKPDDLFPKATYRSGRRAGSIRWGKRCKACKSAYESATYFADHEHKRAVRKIWRINNGESTKECQLRNKYGITLQDWGVMLGKQEGLCAICSSVLDRGKYTHVDHDHNSGRVRAILCSGCNAGLGHFKENAESLRLAANYVQDHAARAVA